MIDGRSVIGSLGTLPFINIPIVGTTEIPLNANVCGPVGIDHDRICIQYSLLTEDNMRYISIHLDMPISFIQSIKQSCEKYIAQHDDQYNLNKYILFRKDECTWSARYMLDT